MSNHPQKSGSLCSGMSGSLCSGIGGSLYSGIGGSLYPGILMLQSRQTYHHSILRQTWPTANRYRQGPKESESIGQPPKILSGGLGGLCSKVSKNGTLAR